MIRRNLLDDLRRWKTKTGHKPLVIRGARQVGKTTLVKEFSKEFDVFVMLNLERPSDGKIFQKADTPQKVMDFLALSRMSSGEAQMFNNPSKSVLLFIDEIQAEPKAVGMLRFFYEDLPHIYVIAAGSRLQELFKTGVSFPVGRVEYLSMRPCFFDEFLDSQGKKGLLEQLRSREVSEVAHPLLMELFQTYSLVGGMPEVLETFALQKTVNALSPTYRGLLQSYDEDVEKYATTFKQVGVLRHLLRNGWNYAGQEISFSRFGGSDFTSLAVRQAFELLEKAFLVSVDYPTTSVRLPLEAAMTRSPKLIWLDAGLVNFSAGIQVEYLSNTSIADVWRGHAAEQIVGQELWKVLDRLYADRQTFWVRDKRGSTAEVDFVFPFQGNAIPIEVKAGANAHLRSLQSYFSTPGAPNLGVRVWPGPLSVDDVRLTHIPVSLQSENFKASSSFRLLNLPFYLIGELDNLLPRYL